MSSTAVGSWAQALEHPHSHRRVSLHRVTQKRHLRGTVEPPQGHVLPWAPFHIHPTL